MAISLCAAICGANRWVDFEKFGSAQRAWFERFLELPNGIPSHDTLGRVFARLDTTEFLLCLQNWLRSLHLSLKGQDIAIDGKTMRGSLSTRTLRSYFSPLSSAVHACTSTR